MATALVPKPGKIARGVTLKQVQKQTHNWLVYAQGDSDKASDLNDHAYWSGMADAYSDVLWFMEQTPVNRLAVGTGKKLFALVPFAITAHYVLFRTDRKDNQPDA